MPTKVIKGICSEFICSLVEFLKNGELLSVFSSADFPSSLNRDRGRRRRRMRKKYESAKGSSPLSAGVGLGWVINRTVKVKRRLHHRSWHVEVFIAAAPAAALDWATRTTRGNQFLTEFCQLLVKERVSHSPLLFHFSPERIELRKDSLSYSLLLILFSLFQFVSLPISQAEALSRLVVRTRMFHRQCDSSFGNWRRHGEEFGR